MNSKLQLFVLLLLFMFIFASGNAIHPKYLINTKLFCPNLVSTDKEWLKELTLRTANLPTLEKADYLRQWVNANIDIGNEGTLIPEDAYQDFSLNDYISIFDNDDGGVHCGGASDFYQKLCNYFGIECYLYNMGGQSNSSHVVNIIKADSLYYLEDAFFNLTIANKQNKPIDFLYFLKKLAINDTSNLVLKQMQPLPEIDFLYPDSTSLFSVLNAYLSHVDTQKVFKTYGKPIIVNTKSPTCKIKMVYPQNFSLVLQVGGYQYYNVLKQHNYPSNFIYLFMLPQPIADSQKNKLYKEVELILNNNNFSSDATRHL